MLLNAAAPPAPLRPRLAAASPRPGYFRENVEKMRKKKGEKERKREMKEEDEKEVGKTKPPILLLLSL